MVSSILSNAVKESLGPIPICRPKSMQKYYKRNDRPEPYKTPKSNCTQIPDYRRDRFTTKRLYFSYRISIFRGTKSWVKLDIKIKKAKFLQGFKKVTFQYVKN